MPRQEEIDSPHILTTPDGQSADFHLEQLKYVAEFLSIGHRAKLEQIKKLGDTNIASGQQEGLESLDLIEEIDLTANTLKLLRESLTGVPVDSKTRKETVEIVKSITTTMSMLIKSAELLMKTSRVSTLQSAILSFADKIKDGEQRVIFKEAIKEHIKKSGAGEQQL